MLATPLAATVTVAPHAPEAMAATLIVAGCDESTVDEKTVAIKIVSRRTARGVRTPVASYSLVAGRGRKHAIHHKSVR